MLVSVLLLLVLLGGTYSLPYINKSSILIEATCPVFPPVSGVSLPAYLIPPMDPDCGPMPFPGVYWSIYSLPYDNILEDSKNIEKD